MFAKTVCRPGSTFTVVPVGLLTTLQYNSNGLLEKVFTDYNERKLDVTATLHSVITKNNLCPLSIPIKGGTTRVQGVFYTTKKFNDDGNLPYCIVESIKFDMKENPHDYMFYAGSVSSLGAQFNGSANMRTWLQLAKFALLPAFIVPAELSDKFIETQLKSDKLFVFEYPLISGALIIDESSVNFVSARLSQVTVKKYEKIVNLDGCIQLRVQSDNKKHLYNYSDVVKYNIQKDSVIITDSDETVIYSYSVAKKQQEPVSNVIVCSTCGNLFRAPASGPVYCTDDHCASKLYPIISHFLSTLNLPLLSATAFQEHLRHKDIQVLSDVLLLDKYKDIEINTSLAKLIQACTPPEVCVDESVFITFTNTCFNQVETVKYYLSNPSKLNTMETNSIFVARFKEWLNDTYNGMIISNCLDNPNIKIDNTSIQAFEGAPMFRNKTIMITGTFTHGDYERVSSILRSYAATVVYDYSDIVDCLIVGDIKSNIAGAAISSMRQNDKPIFEESDFFSSYQIDADLSALNLL